MSQTQPVEKFEEFPPSFEEIQTHLSDDQRDLLIVLFTSDTSALNTSELRKRAGIATGSMRHYTSQLERWELIEEIDRVYAGRGSRAILWQLTERGQAFYEDGLEEDAPAMVRPAELETLREKVEELQQENATMRTAMVQIAVKAGGVTEETAEEWLED